MINEQERLVLLRAALEKQQMQNCILFISDDDIDEMEFTRAERLADIRHDLKRWNDD